MILYGCSVKATQCTGGDYGFLKYDTIFITKYSTLNLTEQFLWLNNCVKIWNQSTISREIYKFPLTSMEILCLKVQLCDWNIYTYDVVYNFYNSHLCLWETTFDNRCVGKCSEDNHILVP